MAPESSLTPVLLPRTNIRGRSLLGAMGLPTHLPFPEFLGPLPAARTPASPQPEPLGVELGGHPQLIPIPSSQGCIPDLDSCVRSGRIPVPETHDMCQGPGLCGGEVRSSPPPLWQGLPSTCYV